MIRNYNSLSSGRDTWLKNDVGEVIGSPPTHSKKVKSSWLLSMVLFASLLLGQLSFAQTVIIGTGASTSGTSDNFSPIYRSSAGSAFNFSQSAHLYTAANLSAAGLPAFGQITSFGFFKTTGATLATGRTANFKVYMKNTSNTALVGTNTLATWISGATLVFSNAAAGPSTFPAAAGVVPLTCIAPFTYTGGAIEVYVDWGINTGSGSAATAAFLWSYDTTAGIQAVGTSSSGAITGALASTGLRRNRMSFTYTPPAACNATPSPGNTTGPSSACSGVSFNLGLQNATVGSGVTYVWESADDALFTVNVLPVAGTNGSISTSQTTAKYYRCTVTCAGNGSATSNPVLVGMNIFTDCYCIPSGGGGADGVTNVVITSPAGNITQASSATNVAPWFTAYANTPLAVTKGQNLSVAITFGTDGSQHSAVWIDYDKSGTFDVSENVALSTVASGGSTTVTYNFTVSPSAPIGTTKIRVRGGSDGAYTTASCATTSFGETEDFFINLIDDVPCNTVGLTAGTIAPGTLSTCTGANSIGSFSATGVSTGSGLTLQWEESPDNGVTPWVNASTGTGATTTTYSPNRSTSMFYRLKVSCSGTDVFSASTVQLTAVNCDYNVTRTPGITYSSIQATGTGLTGFTSLDDSSSSATAIGFNFFYKGTNYSQFVANTNGFLGLGATTSSSFGNGLGTGVNLIAAFWDDLFVTGSVPVGSIGTYIKYKLDGTTPNQVLTVEWIGMEQFQYAGPNLNFQVKLYETSNRIEIIHGSMELYNGTTSTVNTINPYTYSLGLAGPSSNTGTLRTLAQLGENTAAFGTPDSATLGIAPECNVAYTFDAAAAYSGISSFTAVAPANDELATAQPLSVNSAPCTNLCATYYTTNLATGSTIPDATACPTLAPDDDVWFTFIPTTTSITVSVKGATGFDAVVAAYGSDFLPISGFACVNATTGGVSLGQTETLNLTGLSTGVAHYIRVSHAGAGSGSKSGFSICVNSPPPPPSNDDPCGAVVLTPSTSCTPYNDTATNSTTSVLNATNTSSNGVIVPSCAGASATVNDVWYKFTASSTTHGITIVPVAGFDAAVQAYTAAGTCVGNDLVLTPIGCVNGVSTGATEQVVITTTASQEYYLRVYRHPTGFTGAPVSNSQFNICVFNPIPACTTNSTPANLATGLGSTPTLTWLQAAYASNYDIFLGTTSGPTTLLANVVGPTTLTYTLTAPQALAELTQYFWYVVPKNLNGTPVCGVANETSFTTAAIPPTFASFTPNEVCAGGTALDRTVVITGSGFTGATAVSFGIYPVVSFVVDSNTQITAVVDGATTSGNTCTVTKPSGPGTSVITLTVNASPAVNAITGPTSVCIPKTGDPAVTITLSNITPTGTWSSSDGDIATVGSGTGIVTPVGVGPVTISYTVTTPQGCTTIVTYPINVYRSVEITDFTTFQQVSTNAGTTFSVTAIGSGLTYLWEVATYNTVTEDYNPYAAIAGAEYNLASATSSTLVILTAPASFDANQYRCTVSGTCGVDEISEALLLVGAIGVTTQPTNQSFCDLGDSMGTATFAITASASVTDYQWQEDLGGDNWTNLVDAPGSIAGALTNTLVLSGLSYSPLTKRYKCLISRDPVLDNPLTTEIDESVPGANAESTPATLFEFLAPTTTNPSDQTVCYTGVSNVSTFSVTTANAGVIQWKYATSLGGPYNNVVNNTPAGATYAGATTNTLIVTTTTIAQGNYFYQAVVSPISPCTASAESIGAQLIINSPSVTNPAAATVLKGGSTTFSVTATTLLAATYKWQSSVLVGGPYTDVANATPVGVTYLNSTSSTLTVVTTGAAAIGTRFYRAVVSSGVGCSVNSAGAQLTITDYCASTYVSGPLGDEITNVTLGTLSNNSGASTTPYYVFFNAVTIPNIQQNTSITVSVTYAGDTNQFGAVWIDFNRDGIFQTTEGVVSTNAGSGGTSNLVFNVPAGAVLGNTRMRVRGGNDTVLTTAQACGASSSGFGETEDYIVNIIPQITDAPDYVNLQFPATATILAGNSETVYAQVYEPSLTDVEPGLSGQAVGIEAWIGVSPIGSNTNPNTWTSWTVATHNAGFVNNNDEYQANIGAALAAGTYYYASRFRLNGGPFIYGGNPFNAWNGTTSISGVLTVQANPTQCAASIVAPLNAATNVTAGLVALSWTAPSSGPAPTSYNVFFGTTSGSLTLLGNTLTTTINANAPLYSTNYFWRVVPVSVAGGSAVGCVESSFTTQASPFTPYCSNIIFTSAVEPITLVNFAGINNATSAVLNGTPAIENFIPIIGNVTTESSYTMTLKGNSDGNFTNNFRVFVDWNHDNDLNDAGEIFNAGTIVNSTGLDAIQAVTQILIPATALGGTTRMRVKKLFGTTSIDDPCVGGGFGQFEDYTLNVTVCTPLNWYSDADADGYGTTASLVVNCNPPAPTGWVNQGGDCNDGIFAINPGVLEILYDGVDNNCDGNLDEGFQLKTKVLPAQCGATLATLGSLIGVTTLAAPNITGYRFKVTNGASVQTLERTVPNFTLTMLPISDYATTYTVEVELQRSGVWLGYYGDACLVSTPAILASNGAAQVSPSQCGITLPSISTLIATTSLAGVTGYRYRITRAGDVGPNAVQVLDRNFHWFSLTMLAQYNYGSAYTVEVAVKTTGAYSGYGNPCVVSSPAAPSLVICGGTVATAGTLVYCQSLNLATQYRFQVTRLSDNTVVTVDRNLNWFTFNQIPGYTTGAQYGVRVAVQTVTTWSAFGDACEITAPGVLAPRFAPSTPTVAEFKAVASPNPFAADFKLEVTTSSEELVQVKVYDMIGKLIESREVKVSDLSTQEVGSAYPSGVYNIIVTQGANVKTLRVVKR